MAEQGRTVKPAAIPSDDLIREWERTAQSGRHITEFNGVSPCQCWCGEVHEEALNFGSVA